jgi:hypothetical protein
MRDHILNKLGFDVINMIYLYSNKSAELWLYLADNDIIYYNDIQRLDVLELLLKRNETKYLNWLHEYIYEIFYDNTHFGKPYYRDWNLFNDKFKMFECVKLFVKYHHQDILTVFIRKTLYKINKMTKTDDWDELQENEQKYVCIGKYDGYQHNYGYNKCDHGRQILTNSPYIFLLDWLDARYDSSLLEYVLSVLLPMYPISFKCDPGPFERYNFYNLDRLFREIPHLLVYYLEINDSDRIKIILEPNRYHNLFGYHRLALTDKYIKDTDAVVTFFECWYELFEEYPYTTQIYMLTKNEKIKNFIEEKCGRKLDRRIEKRRNKMIRIKFVVSVRNEI